MSATLNAAMTRLAKRGRCEELAAVELRPVRREDGPQVISLVDSVYREYGDRVCLSGADRDLNDLQRAYAAGAFIVLDDRGTVRGTHAVLPLETPSERSLCTFRRLYLDPRLRGQGWGRELMQWALQWARQQHFQKVEFWSDRRFERAHAFFRSLGFQHDGRVRTMDDGAMPYEELFFFRSLDEDSIERLP